MRGEGVGAAGVTPRAFLFDLDGTLYTDAGAIPGAVEAIAELRRRGVAVRFVTNTTRRSRRLLAERLAGYGVAARPEDVTTSVMGGVALLKDRGMSRVAAFVAEATLEDLRDFELGSPNPQAVLVGDLGEEWDFATLNRAFHFLMGGAELIALHRDRYWLRGDGLALDAGPFVVALEFATGKTATVCGKPSAAFYRTAVSALGAKAPATLRDVVMVGDDLWGDVQGAQAAGLTAWMVKTGKFREDVLKESGITPDRILSSVAELPGLF